jgi:hypothetical protein
MDPFEALRRHADFLGPVGDRQGLTESCGRQQHAHQADR